MTLIDQRILINAPPEGVWKQLSDPQKIASWHAGYTSISVLTTQPTGVGARWRCGTVDGKDVIQEITAWVEGLGFEYIVIEGGRYRAFQGRLRLQAGPDGTSVQWTISYRPKGLFGLITERISGRRKLITMMAASLRDLRRAVDTLGIQLDDEYRARVGIQARLNADERAQYQRRYASEDTGSIPVVAEPSFVIDLTDNGESNSADTQPKVPPGLREAIAEQLPDTQPRPTRDTPAAEPTPFESKTPTPPHGIPVVTVEPEPDRSVLVVESKTPTPPHGIPAVTVEPEPDRSVLVVESKTPTSPRGIPAVTVEPEPDHNVPPVVESKTPTPPRGLPDTNKAPTEPKPPRSQPPVEIETARKPGLPPQTPVTDTGEISIWEVFGVRRPSEADSDALNDLVQAVQTKKIIEQRATWRRSGKVRPLHGVMGLRIRLMLAAVRVRWRGR